MSSSRINGVNDASINGVNAHTGEYINLSVCYKFAGICKKLTVLISLIPRYGNQRIFKIYFTAI